MNLLTDQILSQLCVAAVHHALRFGFRFFQIDKGCQRQCPADFCMRSQGFLNFQNCPCSIEKRHFLLLLFTESHNCVDGSNSRKVLFKEIVIPHHARLIREIADDFRLCSKPKESGGACDCDHQIEYIVCGAMTGQQHPEVIPEFIIDVFGAWRASRPVQHHRWQQIDNADE